MKRPAKRVITESEAHWKERKREGTSGIWGEGTWDRGSTTAFRNQKERDRRELIKKTKKKNPPVIQKLEEKAGKQHGGKHMEDPEGGD